MVGARDMTLSRAPAGEISPSRERDPGRRDRGDRLRQSPRPDDREGQHAEQQRDAD